MEKFKDSGYSTHGHFRAELFIISFALLVVGLFVFPKAKGVILDIKLNSAIDSVNSYKESIDSFYVSKLIYDNSFKLDGVYNISDGALVYNDDIYNIMVSGNVPNSGYLYYQDNVLKDGCVVVGNYSVKVLNGQVESATVGTCDSTIAYGI